MSHDPAQLAWRETYFILFGQEDRPTLTQLEGAIADTDARLRIENHQADDDGRFLSLFVHSSQDNAALEICYRAGEEISEEALQLAHSLGKQLKTDQLEQLVRSDARLDIMHFERLTGSAASASADELLGGDSFGGGPLGGGGFEGDDFEEDFAEDDFADEEFANEGFDPALLITVVEALATLTGGLPIDPAAGELLS